MSSYGGSLPWLIAIAFILGAIGIILSMIGSNPGGVLMGAIVIVGCVFFWIREQRSKDRGTGRDTL